MSVDSNGYEPDNSPMEQEGVLFAATPVWDRGRKRRGSGGRRTATVAAPADTLTHRAATVAAEPRSFADPGDDEPAMRDGPLAATYADTPTYAAREDLPAGEEPEGLVAPIGSVAQAPKSHGLGAGALAGGVAAVALIAAGGWYMMRDRDTVPELTPGTTATELAAAPAALPPVNPPLAPAAATPAPDRTAQAEPARTTVRTERRTASAARARPATSASAPASGVDASAALPDGPQPYSAASPAATPAPVNPAPTQVNPPAAEPIPSTPPTAPGAAPATTPDTPPQ